MLIIKNPLEANMTKYFKIKVATLTFSFFAFAVTPWALAYATHANTEVPLGVTYEGNINASPHVLSGRLNLERISRSVAITTPQEELLALLPIFEEELPVEEIEEETETEEATETEEIESYVDIEETNYVVKGALDWFSTTQFLFPREADATVIDVETGRSFRIRRTFGTNHADVEPLTKEDTNTIYELWGGWSWDRRAVVVIVDGSNYVLAGSMNGMPHGGVDHLPALAPISGGVNLDAVKGNGMDGHLCLHFLGSRAHGASSPNAAHQAMVQRALAFIETNWLSH